ncbi:hypothetical protein ABAC460_05510 [Asticcacaulis sp. AC460]|uniref:hypothetical protein n=1 Tax=Asticcacaulis sp. AC460 TaxID=1282360 RepID=UPI0003C3B7D9|nr:hypothetical protein [Asticcacaulis sp. AC460]ESQ91797.1 hypothetical protein ABAC460_05510 [Asticcacaulis sp. AC460]
MKGNKNWQFIAIGAVVAILAAVGVGLMLNRGHKDDPKMNGELPSLKYDVSDPTPQMDPKKPLRCYVNGADVGELTVAECAQKNGIAQGQLDVGVDDQGNIAAAPTGSLVPVPAAPTQTAPTTPTPVTPPATPTVVETPTAPVAGATATCLRFNSGSWNREADNLTLGECVEQLYDGRCMSPGKASYGSWGKKTLRLVPNRVEVSDDNTNFRTLVDQGKGCSVKAQ